jgi:hypothetical protein
MLITTISRTSTTPIRAGNAAEFATEGAYARCGAGLSVWLGRERRASPSPVARLARPHQNAIGGSSVARSTGLIEEQHPVMPEGSRMYLEAGEPNEGEPRSPSAVIGLRVLDRPTRRGTP